MIDTTNPFVEAKVIATDADPVAYHNSSPVHDRGKREFIMSRSELALFRDCPRKWVLGFVRADSDATEHGDVYDAWLLRRNQFDNHYAITPATYPAPDNHARVKKGEIKEGDELPWNANAAMCEAWEKAQGSKIIVPNKVWQKVHGAGERVVSGQDEFLEYLNCSEKQVFVMCQYYDADTKLEIPYKMLIDLVPSASHPKFRKSLGDLKSTTCCRPSFTDRTIDEYSYHLQAAGELMGYVKATGEDRVEFHFLWQEKEHPFEYGLTWLPQEWIEHGAAQLVSGLKFYARCLKTGQWPSYAASGRMVLNGAVQNQLEPWMLKYEEFQMPELKPITTKLAHVTRGDDIIP